MDSFLSFARLSLLYQETWFLVLVMLVPWDPLKVPILDLPLGHIHHWKKTPEWLTLKQGLWCFLVHPFTKLYEVVEPDKHYNTLLVPGLSQLGAVRNSVCNSPVHQICAVEKAQKSRMSSNLFGIWPLSSGWGQVDNWLNLNMGILADTLFRWPLAELILQKWF